MLPRAPAVNPFNGASYSCYAPGVDFLLALGQALTAVPLSAPGDAFSIIRLMENLAGQSPLAGFCYFLWNERKALQREIGGLRDKMDKRQETQLTDALEAQAEQLEANHEQTAAINGLTKAIEERNVRA